MIFFAAKIDDVQLFETILYKFVFICPFCLKKQKCFSSIISVLLSYFPIRRNNHMMKSIQIINIKSPLLKQKIHHLKKV